MSEYTSIKKALDETGTYTGLTRGNSMEPLLHQGKDNIIVVKNKERLKKYDIPVYLMPSGKYIMHRIIDVKEDYYIIMGDNCKDKEIVTDDMICGVLVGFYKNGKHYVDLNKSVLYKLYSRLWVALVPIKPLVMFFTRGFSYIRRHLFTRKDINSGEEK